MSLSPGQFTHTPIRTGTFAVTSTPANPVVAGLVPAQKGIWLRNPGPEADVPNTVSIFIGNSNQVTADVTDPQGGFELDPGAQIFLEIPSLDNIWVVSTGTPYLSWMMI